MKPVCVPCRRFYRPKNIGLRFIEGMPKEGNPRPGLIDKGSWVAYKLWCGDLWECAGCRSTVIVGVGLKPISDHYKPDFSERVAECPEPIIKINDC